MFLARVLGPVVNTVKHPALAGEKLLAVQPLNEREEKQGDVILAIDRAQAGEGDHVLVMREGNGVRQILGRDRGIPLEQAIREEVPIRSMIVGIVDEMTVAPAKSRTVRGAR